MFNYSLSAWQKLHKHEHADPCTGIFFKSPKHVTIAANWTFKEMSWGKQEIYIVLRGMYIQNSNSSLLQFIYIPVHAFTRAVIVKQFFMYKITEIFLI